MTFGPTSDRIEGLLGQARQVTHAQTRAISNATWFTTIRASGRGDTGVHFTEWSRRWEELSHWMNWPLDDLEDEDYEDLPAWGREVEELSRDALVAAPAFARRGERNDDFPTVHRYVTDMARSWIYEDDVTAARRADLGSVWRTVVVEGRTDAYGDPLKKAYNEASCITTALTLSIVIWTATAFLRRCLRRAPR